MIQAVYLYYMYKARLQKATYTSDTHTERYTHTHTQKAIYPSGDKHWQQHWVLRSLNLLLTPVEQLPPSKSSINLIINLKKKMEAAENGGKKGRPTWVWILASLLVVWSWGFSITQEFPPLENKLQCTGRLQWWWNEIIHIQLVWHTESKKSDDIKGI